VLLTFDKKAIFLKITILEDKYFGSALVQSKLRSGVRSIRAT